MKKRINFFFIAAVFLLNLHGQSQLHRAERIFARNSDAVVRIFNFDSGKNLIAQGSGIVIKKQRWLITNLHVIKAEGTYVSYALSGKSYIDLGLPIYADPLLDIIILEIEKTAENDSILKHIPELKIVPFEKLKIGQQLYTIGNPAGMTNTISDGLLSGLRQTTDGVTTLQITSPISSGSSGGAVFDARGRLIGIATSMFQGEGIQNINFAAPASLAIDEDLNSDSVRQARMELMLPDKFFLGGIKNFDNGFYALALLDFIQCERPGYNNKHILQEYMGRCHLRLNNPELALAAFQAAIDYKPEYAPTWVGKSKALMRMGKTKESLEAETKALSLDPDILKIWEDAEK